MAQILAENSINQADPQFVNAAGGDFHPLAGGNILSARTFAIPDFAGGDAPLAPRVPDVNLSNVFSYPGYPGVSLP